MGNQQFKLLGNLESQWQLRQQKGAIYYKNVITSQEFQLQKIENCSNNDLQNYLHRSIYPLPNTPKIILLDHVEPGKDILILVQKHNQQAKDLISKLTYKLQILQHIKKCCQAAQSIYRKYGEYCLTQKMLGFDAKGSILVWFNQHLKQNKPQIFFQGSQINKQRSLILQIIQIYENYCSYDLKDLFLIPLPNSFKFFLIKLNQLIQKQKEKLTTSVKHEVKNHKYSSKPASPKKQSYNTWMGSPSSTLPKGAVPERQVMFGTSFPPVPPLSPYSFSPIHQPSWHPKKQPEKITFQSPKKSKTPKFISSLNKRMANYNSTEQISTKIHRLLTNKEQFLDISFEKDNNQKIKNSQEIKILIDQTISFNQMKTAFSKDHSDINLTQTLPTNMIVSNQRFVNKINQQQSHQKSTKQVKDDDQTQKTGKNKPKALVQLCKKFRESQYTQEVTNCQSEPTSSLNYELSYTFDENRPMTFKNVSILDYQSLSWQQSIAQLIK